VINLHKVDERLWRSGQPTVADVSQLSELGVVAILVLNGSHGEFVRQAQARRRTVYVYTITDEEAQGTVSWDASILDRIDTLLCWPSQGPWFVHCTEGVDRTGIVVARYRVRKHGWSKQQAWDEWVSLGSHSYAGLVKAWNEWIP
jgi:tyrosine-protein phosphatase SIW14